MTCSPNGMLVSNRLLHKVAYDCKKLTFTPNVQDIEKVVFNDEAEVAAACKREELISQLGNIFCLQP